MPAHRCRQPHWGGDDPRQAGNFSASRACGSNEAAACGAGGVPACERERREGVLSADPSVHMPKRRSGSGGYSHACAASAPWLSTKRFPEPADRVSEVLFGLISV